MNRLAGIFCSATVLVLLTALPAAAQADEAGKEKSIWEGVYTSEQADRGQTVYDRDCSLCHASQEWTTPIFMRMWQGRSIRALYDNVRLTMPYDSPGRLTREEYAEIIAYMLSLNDVPAGEHPLPSDQEGLDQIMMTPQADQ